MWRSGRDLSACKRPWFESRQLHFLLLFFIFLLYFLLLYYFTRNANRPICRVGLSASAELLVYHHTDAHIQQMWHVAHHGKWKVCTVSTTPRPTQGRSTPGRTFSSPYCAITAFDVETSNLMYLMIISKGEKGFQG